MSTPVTTWLRTNEAAYALRISPGHLKRLMDSKGGPLIEREHYQLGPTRNSAILWHVEAVRECLHRRGMVIRRGEQSKIKQSLAYRATRQLGS